MGKPLSTPLSKGYGRGQEMSAGVICGSLSPDKPHILSLPCLLFLAPNYDLNLLLSEWSAQSLILICECVIVGEYCF